MSALVVLVAVVALVGLGAAALYNRLVTTRNGYRNAFSQIDVQLKRRHDLVPNLVETAKAYLAHERGTLEAVTAARGGAAAAIRAAEARPGEPRAMQAVAQAEGVLSGALGRLVAVAEAYPPLQANATMARLMEELASTENRIAFARQAYNDAVMDHNNARETFPGALVAGSFPRAEPLAAPSPAEREPVRVAF